MMDAVADLGCRGRVVNQGGLVSVKRRFDSFGVKRKKKGWMRRVTVMKDKKRKRKGITNG
jgi:hypothetical protein